MKASTLHINGVYEGKSGRREIRKFCGGDVIWLPVGRPLLLGERNFCSLKSFARWAQRQIP